MTADVRTIPAGSTLNAITTNIVLKGGSGVTPSPGQVGIFRKIICQVQNTAACYLNDGTSTASGSNTFWQIGSAGMTVGAVTSIDWPLTAGLSFVPGGGTFSLAWD
jgi:hypothetical protein